MKLIISAEVRNEKDVLKFKVFSQSKMTWNRFLSNDRELDVGQVIGQQ